jgi:hypothetical protein
MLESGSSALDPGNVVPVEDFSNETLENIANHLDASTRFDHFIYRESELDGICRLVEEAMKETPASDLHAVSRLQQVLGAARAAHDLVADERPDEAARSLRSVL